MSFTYSLPPEGIVDQMRLLIGDTNSANPNFQDEELQTIANIIGGMESGWPTVAWGAIPQNELLLLCCAQAMDCLASRVASFSSGQTVTIGDYKLTGKDQVKAIQDIANRFRDAVNNLPAWGIIEENLCGFNEMVIIRNWVLRTEL
jgi:hypothetical protein